MGKKGGFPSGQLGLAGIKVNSNLIRKLTRPEFTRQVNVYLYPVEL